MDDLVIICVVGFGLAIACAVLGAWIAGQKRRGTTEGAVLGFAFGPLGVIVELLLPNGVQGSKRPSQSKFWDQPPEPTWLQELDDSQPASPERAWLRELEGREDLTR